MSESKQAPEVSELVRVAAVAFCRKHDLNYTLGTMLQMAIFAEEYSDGLRQKLRKTQGDERI
jgi:hypothetical protein